MHGHGPHKHTHARTRTYSHARAARRAVGGFVSASALYPLDVVKTRMQAGQKVRASLQRPKLAAMSIGHTVHTVLHCHHLASNVLFNTVSQRSSVTVCDCVTAIQKHDTSRRVSLIHCRMQPACCPAHLLDTSSAAQWPDNAHSETQTTVWRRNNMPGMYAIE